MLSHGFNCLFCSRYVLSASQPWSSSTPTLHVFDVSLLQHTWFKCTARYQASAEASWWADHLNQVCWSRETCRPGVPEDQGWEPLLYSMCYTDFYTVLSFHSWFLITNINHQQQNCKFWILVSWPQNNKVFDPFVCRYGKIFQQKIPEVEPLHQGGQGLCMHQGPFKVPSSKRGCQVAVC